MSEVAKHDQRAVYAVSSMKTLYNYILTTLVTFALRTFPVLPYALFSKGGVPVLGVVYGILWFDRCMTYVFVACLINCLRIPKASLV
jgi:hypothetical protein